MTAKHLNHVFIAAVATLTLCACGPKSDLEIAADRLNEKCPFVVELSQETINAVFTNDTTAIIECQVDDYGFSFVEEAVEYYPEAVEQSIALTFMFADELEDFFEAIVAANAGIEMRYSNEAGAMVIATVSAEFIQQIYDYLSSENEALAILNAQIATTNDSLPNEAEPGVTLEKLSVDGNYVVFHFSVDENVRALSEIEGTKEEMQDALLEWIYSENDSAQMAFVDLFCASYKGIEHRYKGNRSQDSVQVKVPWYMMVQ